MENAVSCVMGFRGDGRPWIQVQAYINACFQERRRFAVNKNFTCPVGGPWQKVCRGAQNLCLRHWIGVAVVKWDESHNDGSMCHKLINKSILSSDIFTLFDAMLLCAQCKYRMEKKTTVLGKNTTLLLADWLKQLKLWNIIWHCHIFLKQF